MKNYTSKCQHCDPRSASPFHLAIPPSFEKVLCDLLAWAIGAENIGVPFGKEVANILWRLHERFERSFPFSRLDDHRRHHSICLVTTGQNASVAIKTEAFQDLRILLASME